MSIRIPERGVDHDAVLATMEEFRAGDLDWAAGRAFSLVYYAGDAHYRFLKKAHNLYFSENALNPVAFKSLKRMEAEVVRMTATMLNGDAETVGTMTSGGTESLLMAVKAYRDLARKKKPWIRNPEMVVPKTIHVGFDKAAHYFGVKPKYVPLTADYRVDVAAMRKAINRNTIMVAASAPQYCQGVIDPIAEIGALAQEKGLPFHVDACIGGFMLPWVEKLGHAVPEWDFRVPGVTSISADVHKYGYSAKGASIIVYRNMSYLKNQFFVSTDWPGGIYISPSMLGTRAGGPIAAAWGAMMAMGESGYMERAEAALSARDQLMAGIRAIAPLQIQGSPQSTIICFESTDPAVDIYAVADYLEDQGWDLARQQDPKGIHLTVNGNHLEIVGAYLAILRDAVAHVRANPELGNAGRAAMYGMMAKVPFRGLVKQSVLKVMEQMYGPEGADPDLENLGSGDDDGWLLQSINKYGDQAMDFIDRHDTLRSIFDRVGRNR